MGKPDQLTPIAVAIRDSWCRTSVMTTVRTKSLDLCSLYKSTTASSGTCVKQDQDCEGVVQIVHRRSSLTIVAASVAGVDIYCRAAVRGG